VCGCCVVAAHSVVAIIHGWNRRSRWGCMLVGFFVNVFFYLFIFCWVSGNGLLLRFPLPALLHTLRSVFIVQKSHRLREIKSQSNSFSFLKFELESNSKSDNYHYLEGKDYLEDKDKMAKAHCSP